MRKNNTGKKLSRGRDQRRALLRGLANALILKNKLITTEAKAKELRRFIEPLIKNATRNTVSMRRLGAKNLNSAAARKLFAEVAPRNVNRQGGYTRLARIPSRKTDAAKMAVVEIL